MLNLLFIINIIVYEKTNSTNHHPLPVGHDGRAERIDVSTARKVAENVANAGSGLRSAGDLTLVYAAAPGKSSSALRSGTVDGAADYFVFNVPGNKGFVIVSGDDRAYPVLGQSDEGNFDPDNLPENLRAILAYIKSKSRMRIK